MIEFEYIDNILINKPPFCVPTDNEKNYRLEESQDSVLKRKGLNQNILINDNDIQHFKLYKFDTKTPDPFPFLNTDNETLPKSVRSFCDYFAICTYKNKFYIVLFELKAIEKIGSKGDEKKEAKLQLQISECFAKYVLDLANTSKEKNKSTYKGIENSNFTNDNIKKCIIMSVIKNPPTATTNPRKSKKLTNIQHEGRNVYVGFFKIHDEFALADLFSLF